MQKACYNRLQKWCKTSTLFTLLLQPTVNSQCQWEGNWRKSLILYAILTRRKPVGSLFALPPPSKSTTMLTSKSIQSQPRERKAVRRGGIKIQKNPKESLLLVLQIPSLGVTWSIVSSGWWMIWEMVEHQQPDYFCVSTASEHRLSCLVDPDHHVDRLTAWRIPNCGLLVVRIRLQCIKN